MVELLQHSSSDLELNKILAIMDLDNGGGGKRVFNRLGGSQQQHQPQFNSEPQKVCFHWRAGRCTRHPCPYLHSELPHQNNVKRPSHGAQDDRSFQGQGFARRKSNQNNSNHQAAPSKWGRGHGGTGGSGGYSKPITKHQDKICHFWVDGKCSYGEKCRYLHQWFTSDSFTMLTQLPGHEKVISAIAFPMGSDKLYSGSKDKSVRVWDCQTGQCAGVVNLEGEIGCIITEGPWIFVGVPNVVKVLLEEESILIYTSGSDGSLFNTRDMNAALPGKRLSIFGRLLDSPWKRTFISKYGTQELDCFKRQAWNTQTNTELPLSGPVGQVYAMVVGNGMLFAGTQDGSILAWRFSASTNCFEPTASLKGHTLAVVSLVVGANRLYSGSMDNTIRVWDLENLQCIQTLTEHTSVVMAVLCWEQFLLSCSLDRTIKVWAATETGTLEVTYTHTEDQGVLGLCGMHDAQSKPVLMCSCNNNTVHLYDLPSFNERGKIFSKEEVRALEVGPGGLFFTGDGTGELKVWRWSDTPPASA